MILDTKGEILFDDLDPISSLSQVKRATDCIVYRPNGDEKHDESKLDKFIMLATERDDDCIIVIDELTSLGDSIKAKPGLNEAYSRGRHHKSAKGKYIRTTAIGGTQAPFFVPRMIYRQSRSFAVFRLNDANDRKVVARFTHPALKENPDSTVKHAFWHFFDEDTEPVKVVLRFAA